MSPPTPPTSAVWVPQEKKNWWLLGGMFLVAVYLLKPSPKDRW